MQWDSIEMFVPDTPSFCDHIYSLIWNSSVTLLALDDTGLFESLLLPSTPFYLIMGTTCPHHWFSIEQSDSALLQCVYIHQLKWYADSMPWRVSGADPGFGQGAPASEAESC